MQLQIIVSICLASASAAPLIASTGTSDDSVIPALISSTGSEETDGYTAPFMVSNSTQRDAYNPTESLVSVDDLYSELAESTLEVDKLVMENEYLLSLLESASPEELSLILGNSLQTNLTSDFFLDEDSLDGVGTSKWPSPTPLNLTLGAFNGSFSGISDSSPVVNLGVAKNVDVPASDDITATDDAAVATATADDDDAGATTDTPETNFTALASSSDA